MPWLPGGIDRLGAMSYDVPNCGVLPVRGVCGRTNRSGLGGVI
jgi:hypothetical protein